MDMTKTEYEKIFNDFIIVDCAVRSKDIFYFSLCRDESVRTNLDNDERAEWLTRRIAYFIKTADPALRWGNVDFHNSDNYKIAVSAKPKEQIVCVDRDGQVYALGSGSSELENPIPDWNNGGILRGGVWRSRTIDGNAYIAGGGRAVAYRSDRNKWTSLMKELPFNHKEEWETAGFRDIDGFNADDIYCVGGIGDVWHFDGKIWTQIHFPGNIHLYSICCAGDGEVYISGYGGTTFKGRGHKWQKIYKGELTIPFKDMIWYEDQVWCTSDYGL